MRRLLTWLAGGLGAAALVRELLRRQPAPPISGPPPADPSPADPAEELRAKLEQAREAADDRDEFDAAEGTPVDTIEQPRPAETAPPVDEVERPGPPEEAPEDAPEDALADEAEQQRSLEERRRRVHDKAQEALGHMRGADDD